jgi:hypothetical protein
LGSLDAEDQGESNGGITASKWSPETAGGELMGWRNTAHGARPNQDEIKIFKMLRWFTSSPDAAEMVGKVVGGRTATP